MYTVTALDRASRWTGVGYLAVAALWFPVGHRAGPRWERRLRTA
ncbi:hypothetical protein [Haloarcula sp. JP-L23]